MTRKWQDQYRARKTTPQKAVQAVQSGHRVLLGTCCGEPQTLVEALIADRERLKQVELVTMLLGSRCEYSLPGMEGHFRLHTFRGERVVREAIRDGRADFVPCHLSEIPRLFTDGILPIDVALVQVSPPDSFGYCSFGISVDFTKPGAEEAGIIIAEVNDQMPRTLGDTFIHVSELDYIVETSRPLLILPPPNIGEVEQAIARYVAEMIPDGSTLQLGVGAIPDAILRFLTGKKDLGIHSGMLSDGIIDLVDAGIITNRCKNLNKGKMVVTVLMGTENLYRFADNNPFLEMYPVTYTHDILVLGELENLVSINSALQVDLTGQINAEVAGGFQISGVGGQMDFVRGAARSPGGKSIIAIPSTAGEGRYSRIVPRLEPEAAVTTTRSDVQYVVTEYGVAELRGKSLRQRGEALAAIAHPRFRDQLLHPLL